MDPAEGNDRFVTDLLAEGTWLRKAEVVRVEVLPAAHEASLLHDEPEMLFVAIAARLSNGEDALVHSLGRGVTGLVGSLQFDRRHSLRRVNVGGSLRLLPHPRER